MWGATLRRKASATALACIAIVLLAHVARAEPSALSRADAYKLFDRAFVLAHDEGDFETARVLNAQAYTVLADDPRVLFNLAFTEVMSCHPREGLAHLDEYRSKRGADPRRVDFIQTTLRPRALADAAFGCLSLLVARVVLDGSAGGRHPVPSGA